MMLNLLLTRQKPEKELSLFMFESNWQVITYRVVFLSNQTEKRVHDYLVIT